MIVSSCGCGSSALKGWLGSYYSTRLFSSGKIENNDDSDRII